MNTTENTIIAIDIAKETLEVRTVQNSFRLNYNEKGLKKLWNEIRNLPDVLVVCEATGGYEQALVSFLHERAIALSVVNPNRVRAFARSDGIKAKTDSIDTAVLLRFAQHKRLRLTPAPPPAQKHLIALLDRRGHLSNEIAREKNRLEKAPQSLVASIRRMIRFIDKEIAGIEKKIQTLIAEQPEFKVRDQIITSVRGVGKVTSWTLLAYMCEITQLNRNQLVALAGVAPFNRDSGKKIGKRSIYGGRAKVRKCLYMAARSAAQHNPVIKAYVDGLKARGKPYKCALVAAMRKLLIHIQSLLKNHHFSLAS